MKKVTVHAPAKLNLALDITGLAENGYHLVDMLMQAIGLYERVEISKSTGFSLRCPGSHVTTGPGNTAAKAAQVFFYETGLLAGADITIHKAVPMRAGMAGGSADAAAVLVGLNELYGAHLGLQELCRLGAQVGADVPFAILGGTARVTGIGEILRPLPPLPPCWFAIAMPKGGVSTPVAYKLYDELGSPVHPNMEAVEEAVCKGSLAALAPHMQNALQHANGGEITPKICVVLQNSGALASMMTGSGAAVFGLFEAEAPARAAAHALKSLVPKTFVAQPTPLGAQVIQRY